MNISGLLIVGTVLLVTGCTTIDYYAQSLQGQLDLLVRRQPIDELLNDPDTPELLKQRLRLVTQLRYFASSALKLPDNDSYLSYVDLGREAMVWNVVAAPEFSLQPHEWCYPLIGCASYRGFFSHAKAVQLATVLRQRKLDVVVQPVPAYSTLGWFDDPIPNTVVYWEPAQIAGLMFHELAHQRLYVAEDTAFNEAFANTVGQVGVKRWQLATRSSDEYESWLLAMQRRMQFIALLMSTRARLVQLYQSDQPDQEKRKSKQRAFQQLRFEYRLLKEEWGGFEGFDHWFELAPLNNARLASIATYHHLMPAFIALLEQQHGDLQAFYQACELLGDLPSQQRHRRLLALTSVSSQ